MSKFKIKIELNHAAIDAFLRGDEVKSNVRSVAAEVAERCGEGYKMGEWEGSTRHIAFVSTDSAEAVTDNIENNTLLKAVSR